MGLDMCEGFTSLHCSAYTERLPRNQLISKELISRCPDFHPTVVEPYFCSVNVDMELVNASAQSRAEPPTWPSCSFQSRKDFQSVEKQSKTKLRLALQHSINEIHAQ